MARLFRDLKVNEQDGKIYLTLYNRDGSTALRDVSVGLSSEVVQPGDNWTAAAANLLLRLDEDGQPQLALTPEQIGAAAAGDGVILYAHQKNGAVHTLVGSGDNIRFVATADFAEGDTFTVNGSPCSAKTIGGDPLWTGFFKTGAVVVCWKNGNALTFNGGGLPAAEAAKLAPGNLKTGVSITANGKTVTGTFTADGTVAAGQMLKGAVGYAKGQKITGSIPSKGAAGYRPGTKAQTIAAGQYLSGVQTIQGDANLLAANIRRGVSIFGVSGSLTVESLLPSDGKIMIGYQLDSWTADRSYRVPIAGNYTVALSFMGHDGDNNGDYYARIQKNGANIKSESSDYEVDVNWSETFYCNAGDTITVQYGGYFPRRYSHLVYKS